MTVLPYIVVSLILNIGRMTMSDARILAKNGVVVLLSLWGIGAITVIVFGFSFPTMKTGSFFSTSLVEQVQPVDIVSLFIPANLFHSLSANLVPAVVLFCILFGIALLNIQNKQLLLDQLDVMAEGLRKMNGYAVKVTPIGLFAITASAAGTLTLQEFSRLQIYLITDTAASILLTLLVLPMLIAACTPFRYRDILATSKEALVTAFITSSVFVVIPMLIDGINELFAKHTQADENLAGAPEFIVPLGYPFPDIGKVLSLLFIQFAAWFYSGTIPLESYLFTLPVGLVLCFGKLVTAIPFLLDAQKIPTDIFQLWLMAGVYSSRVGDLLGCVHLLTFTIITTSAMRGLLRIQKRKLLQSLVLTAVIAAATVSGIRSYVEFADNDTNQKSKVLSEMKLVADPVKVQILKDAMPNPVRLKPDQSSLDRIKKRHVIRVGFNPDRLPFSYLNAKGQLVGFDVELIYHLARDLKSGVELVPYSGKKIVDHFEKDHFDIAISGIFGTLEDESKLSADLLHSKLKSLRLLSEDRSPAQVDDVLNEHMMSWIVRTGLILRGGHNFGAIVLKDHYWQDESGRRQPLVIFRSAYTAYPERDGSCFGSLLESANVSHVVNIYGDDFIYVQDLDQAEKHAAENAGATYALTDKMGYGPWRHTIAEHPLPDAERKRAMNDVARLINEQILHPGGNPPRGNILIHCGGGMHRTGMIIGILQKVINGMPMEAIAAEYRYHVSYQNEDDPGGFEQGNLDFIRDFDPRLIAE